MLGNLVLLFLITRLDLQLRSHSSIQERLHCNFLEVLHENHRYSMLSFTFSGENLTESDCSLVGAVFSTPFGCSKSFDEVNLPSGSENQWFWLTDWKVDMSYPDIDENGWLYATSFEVSDDAWGPMVAPSLFQRSTWVRRRRWVRVRKQRLSLIETPQHSSFVPDRENVTVGTMVDESDYILQASALVKPSSPKRRNSSASVRGLSTELELYDEAIQIILQGIKSICYHLIYTDDQNLERIERGKSLADSYLRHGDTLRSLLDTLKGSQALPSSSMESSINQNSPQESNEMPISADLESFPEVSSLEYGRDLSYISCIPAPWQPGIILNYIIS